MQGLFSICKESNVIHHINILKKKNYVTISIDAEKALGKIQHPFLIWKTNKKTSQKNRTTKKLPQLDRGFYETPIVTIINNSEKLSMFPITLGTRGECLLLPFILNIVLEVLDNAVRQEKDIEIMQIGKEVKFLHLQTVLSSI